ncbi:20S proteasome alpha subunit G [Plasmodium ovale wallikeri]|uniref:20S proteasome alpha subunit G n=1 Tax=Plasmodium ovale wallikeri TaxID=864142 RepID=A0A1A8YSG7_PLAOA|nr:20S proteasome alpha subunit G [Plasmodium ovale wallikeri]
MAGLSAGYDLSVSTFSPDGRLYQVEYIYKLINNNNTALSLECRDGIISCCINSNLEKTKMLKKCSYNRIYHINNNIIITYAGLDGDARNIIDRAKRYSHTCEQSIHVENLHVLMTPIFCTCFHALFALLLTRLTPLSVPIITTHYPYPLSLHFTPTHYHYTLPLSFTPTTLYSYPLPLPFCAGEIYCIEPNGACYKYAGVVIGKNKEILKTELEKKNYKTIDTKEALIDIYKFILTNDDHMNKDNLPYLVNFSWVCEESSYEFQHIDQDTLNQALKAAADSIEQQNQ